MTAHASGKSVTYIPPMKLPFRVLSTLGGKGVKHYLFMPLSKLNSIVDVTDQKVHEFEKGSELHTVHVNRYCAFPII